MAVKIFLLTTVIAIVRMASSASVSQPSSSGLFAADLFSQISKEKTTENVILSPISIQTALAMLYLGSEGETAKELEKGLRLPSSDKEVVGKAFAEILKEKKGEAQLSIANRIFVNPINPILPAFNGLAKQYFNSEAETVNFAKSSEAIDTINTWIEEKTNNKIKNLMQPGSVDGGTSAVLVNAIYFKGKWKTPFSKGDTVKKAFWTSPTKSADVETMHGDGNFKFGVFPELDATAVEMPYKDSTISMILILPNERNGLVELENKLSTVAMNDLSSTMTTESVKVEIPKFKIEFATALNDPLQAIGIRSIFKDDANLSGIFQGPPVKVSDAKHKAFIDVNEAGSEAAAATFLKVIRMSLNLNQKSFKANRPFVFAIKSPETVYFMGHVATL